MIIRSIVYALVLALGGVAAWFWRSKLRSYAEAFRSFAKTFYKWSLGSSTFWGLAETFWNEAAVLWFVFPVLDGFYEVSKDGPPPSVKSILVSFAIAGLFFLAAVYSEKKKKKLEKLEKGE